MPVRAANLIHTRFDDYHERFRAATRRARERFEAADWRGIREQTVERLELHGRCIARTLEAVAEGLGERVHDRAVWSELKDAYTRSILGRDDFELAQTFFNSLARRVFPHFGVDPAIDYTGRDFPLPYRGWEMASARMYAVHAVDGGVVRRILEDAGFRVPFRDLDLQAAQVAARVQAAVARRFPGGEIEALDVLRPVLVRNKAAYVVGRARAGGGLLPIVLAVLHDAGELVVDAVLETEEDVSTLLSFARWYFHAELDAPREAIGFLRSLVPRKRVSELYISLGYDKHGKTEFFHDLMRTIGASDERFVEAPGQRGLVMAVFTLPSFEFVFKVIKDRFPAPKTATREEVRSKYRLVQLHDRVGRLVDFQEFEHLTFPRARFSPQLLDDLVAVAGETVRVEGDVVSIRHLYVGRRVRPLDLHLREAPPAEARRALLDYGRALKELAAADIFAGDMLIKNFGVTRHGRIVFYDYDEVCPLGECRFRRLPEARHPEDEIAAEPWFSVREGDVFPEELRTFLPRDPDLAAAFDGVHGDLFDPAFWREVQERNRRGEVIDFFPYGESRRLPRPAPP